MSFPLGSWAAAALLGVSALAPLAVPPPGAAAGLPASPLDRRPAAWEAGRPAPADGQADAGRLWALHAGAVRLLTPTADAPLVAGSAAVLEWAPGPGFERLAAREEWEAFLSLDGGRSYPVRITPHLDAALRRASWEVPALPSADVRILLRLGDERHETLIELPERFAIAAPATAGGLRGFHGFHLPPALSARPGEAARPGDPGVRIWSEGPRGGGGGRLLAAAEEAPHGLRAGRGPLPPELTPEGAPLAAAVAPRAALAPPPTVATVRRVSPTLTAPPSRGGPPEPRMDVLLQAMRRNE